MASLKAGRLGRAHKEFSSDRFETGTSVGESNSHYRKLKLDLHPEETFTM